MVIRRALQTKYFLSIFEKKQNMKIYFSIFTLFFSFVLLAQTKDLLTGNTTPTYDELIDFYRAYATNDNSIQLYAMGNSDYGKPIYVCVLGALSDSSQTFNKARNATTLLINNGIHPGEPCGVNASMQLVNDYSQLSEKERKAYPVVAIIPAYNVGGMHNRSGFSRANQEGPEEYGFRGNTRNFDLNRDFIKMDSENAKTFAKLFHALDPDVFIDTHTSNGADYQYTMTYIAPTYDRMPAATRTLMYEELIPFLDKKLSKQWKYDLTPYVSMNSSRLDDGIHAFNALPRYAMGYGELFHTLSFTTETHMLKPFEDRVRSTYAFIVETIDWMADNSLKLERARQDAKESFKNCTLLPTNYTLDTDRKDSILFKGFEWSERPSLITEQPRLFYDRSKPFTRYIPHYFHYKATDTVQIPAFYVIGAHEKSTIQMLKMNNVQLIQSSVDSTIQAKGYKIIDFSNGTKPYEGHYLHSKTSLEIIDINLKVKKGDYIIPMKQDKAYYIVSVLDPRMEDSFFAWNFYDSYLQQKEYFSSYVFEEKAVELLKNNPALEKEFRQKQKEDTKFKENRWEQLYFIYQHSPYYEPTHNALPIYFVLNTY